MKTLNKLGVVGLAVASLSALSALPASAQGWRDGRGGYEGERLTGRYDALEWQVRNAANEGRIPWGQANRLLDLWRVNQPLAWRVETGRASPRERRRVFAAMSRIEATLSRSQRYSRYDDRYGRDYDRGWRR